MLRFGRTSRAWLSRYSATTSGVEWQLSIRNPEKYFAMSRVYLVMKDQRNGLSWGRDPYRSFTQSPQTITSRRRYAFESGPALSRMASAFQTQPLFTNARALGLWFLVVSLSGNLVKYASTKGFVSDTGPSFGPWSSSLRYLIRLKSWSMIAATSSSYSW